MQIALTHRIQTRKGSKPGGTVVVEATVPLSIKKTKKGRVFNMVPGAEAVPMIAQLPKQAGMRALRTISVT